MACCLMAWSHYLDQFWTILERVPQQIVLLKLVSHPPGAIELMPNDAAWEWHNNDAHVIKHNSNLELQGFNLEYYNWMT